MKNEINWEEVRVQAAIAMAPRCHEEACNILKMGKALPGYNTIAECVADNAIAYADELVKRLHSGDRYKDGYRDAQMKIATAIAGKTNNLDRLKAVYKILEGDEEGGK